MEFYVVIIIMGLMFLLEIFHLLKSNEIILKNMDIELSPLRLMLLSGLFAILVFNYLGHGEMSRMQNQEIPSQEEAKLLTEEIFLEYMTANHQDLDEIINLVMNHQDEMTGVYESLLKQVAEGNISKEALRQELATLQEANKALRDELAILKNKPARDNQIVEVTNTYQNGIYEGQGEGYNGIIKLEVTIKNDKIMSVKNFDFVDDLAWFNRAKVKLIPQVLESQSAELDVVSGATYSSQGILDAIKDALEKAKVN